MKLRLIYKIIFLFSIICCLTLTPKEVYAQAKEKSLREDGYKGKEKYKKRKSKKKAKKKEAKKVIPLSVPNRQLKAKTKSLRAEGYKGKDRSKAKFKPKSKEAKHNPNVYIPYVVKPEAKTKSLRQDGYKGKNVKIPKPNSKGDELVKEQPKYKSPIFSILKKMHKANGDVVIDPNKRNNNDRYVANYTGATVVIDPKRNKKISKKAADHGNYVVIDLKKNKRISKAAANYEQNYIVMRRKMSFMKMSFVYSGKVKWGNRQTAPKPSFGIYMEKEYAGMARGKSNFEKNYNKDKYSYDKGETALWNSMSPDTEPIASEEITEKEEAKPDEPLEEVNLDEVDDEVLDDLEEGDEEE